MAGLKRRKRIYALLSIGIMAAIFLFSAQPGSESSSTSFFLARFLSPVIGEDAAQFVVRKAAHFTIYMILGFCVYGSFGNRKKHVTALLVCVLYACTDEFHQLFVPGRSGQFTDVLIDGLGSLLGIIVSCLVNNSSKK